MLYKAKNVNIYFVLLGFWFLLLASAVLFIPKYELFILINHHRSFLADIVFTFFTELGSGWILLPLGVYFLIKKKYKIVLSIAIILVVNSLVVSWLKHSFYMPRPFLCYGNNVMTASWVSLHQKYSFPSGHTALAFAIATYISFLFKQNSIKLFCFLTACIIGYSRVYLGQHFILDVFSGSILGSTIASVYYFASQAIINNKLRKSIRIEPSL